MLKGGCALSMCVKGYLGKTGGWGKANQRQGVWHKGRFQNTLAGGDFRTLTRGHHPLQSAQMPCCPRQLSRLRKDKDAEKEERKGPGSPVARTPKLSLPRTRVQFLVGSGN